MDTERAFEEGLRLGIRIAKGELMQVEITPDMVGKTLVIEKGETWWVPANNSTVKKTGPRRNAKFNDAILGIIRDFKGEEVPISMIMDHMVEKGFYKPRSARTAVRVRLDQLAEEGLVRIKSGPGEITATLVI